MINMNEEITFLGIVDDEVSIRKNGEEISLEYSYNELSEDYRIDPEDASMSGLDEEDVSEIEQFIDSWRVQNQSHERYGFVDSE